MWRSAKFHLKLRASIQILDLYLVLLTEYIQDQKSCQAPVYQAKESLTLAYMILYACCDDIVSRCQDF